MSQNLFRACVSTSSRVGISTHYIWHSCILRLNPKIHQWTVQCTSGTRTPQCRGFFDRTEALTNFKFPTQALLFFVNRKFETPLCIVRIVKSCEKKWYGETIRLRDFRDIYWQMFCNLEQKSHNFLVSILACHWVLNNKSHRHPYRRL